MSINTFTIVKSLIPNNRVANEARTTLSYCEKKLKMMNIGMGEYTLDSIGQLLVSHHSYGKASKNMEPSSLAMTIYDTFV